MITREDLKAHRDAVYSQQAEQAVEPAAEAPVTFVTPPPPLEMRPGPARKIDTNENRFHALKFALQTPIGNHRDALKAAEAYLRFLEGAPEPEPALAPEQPSGESMFFVGSNGSLYELKPEASPFHKAPQTMEWQTELSDLTNSYPADEPFVPPLGSGPEGGEMAEAFAAEPEPVVAVADSPLEEELFGLQIAAQDGPFATAEDCAAIGLPTTFDEVETVEAPFLRYNGDNTFGPEPTFEQVAAAVQEIASPPPPAPDTTDEPELTDEQVERAEERLATQDPIGAAEQRELEPVADLYVNRVPPRHRWPWMP